MIKAWREFDRRSRAWMAENDLHKRFPGYFSRWPFWGAIAVLTALWVFLMVDNSFGTNVHVYCPKDALGGKCSNPFFREKTFGGITLSECYAPQGYEELCLKPVLLAGESYGQPESWLSKYFPLVAVGLAGLAFGLNHLAFCWRSGRWSY